MTSTRLTRKRMREGQWIFALVLFGLAIASLLSAAPAFTGGWFLATAVLTGAMVAVGAGVRSVSAGSLNGRITAWWLQAATALAALLVFEALWSNLSLGPVETAVSFGDSFARGIGDIAWYHAIPIPMDSNVRAAIMSAGALLVLLNDFVMRVVRLPVVAVVWLFLPVALPVQLGLDPSYVPVIAVSVLFAIALILSAPRAVRFGKRALAATAAVAAAVIALPLVLPNPAEVEVRAPDWLVQEGNGILSAGTPILSTDIDLTTNLRRPAPVAVLEYQPRGVDRTYLQLTTLGDVSQGGFLEYPEGTDIEQLPFDDVGSLGWGDIASVTVRSLGLRSDNLPVPVATGEVASDDLEFAYDPLTESYQLDGRTSTIPRGATWETSVGRGFSLSWHAFSGTAYVPEPGRPHTELPEELSALRDVAREIVAESDGTDIGMLQALEWWFHDPSWQYSETVPFAQFGDTSGGQWASLLEFVEERVGYCVHYASLFTMLARALDIPSRVVVGFLPGQLADEPGWRVVTTNDMHAWSEVYVENLGWVIVDVTPPVLAGQGQASDTDDSPWGPYGSEPTPRSPEEPSAPSVSPSASGSPSEAPEETDEPSLAPEASANPSSSDSPETADDPGGGADAGGIHPGWLVTLLVLFVMLLPIGVRYGIRLARFAEGAAGAWRETVAQAMDTGMQLPKHATGELLAGVMSEHLGDEGRQALARLRTAAEAEAFGHTDVPPGSNDAARADARVVTGELWQRLPAGRAALRRFLPASLLPEGLRPDPAHRLPSNE